jgi:hypothetical protein
MQTIESNNRTEAAASLRSREGPVKMHDMIIDYRMLASPTVVP